MDIRTSDLLVNVQPAHTFDEEALLVYARANVQGFPPSLSKFVVPQFGHGQSNPTLLLEVGSGAALHAMCLERSRLGSYWSLPMPLKGSFRAQGMSTVGSFPKISESRFMNLAEFSVPHYFSVRGNSCSIDGDFIYP